MVLYWKDGLSEEIKKKMFSNAKEKSAVSLRLFHHDLILPKSCCFIRLAWDLSSDLVYSVFLA